MSPAERIPIRSGMGYEVLTGPGLLPTAGTLLAPVLRGAQRLAVVTDSHVAPLYLRPLREALESADFTVSCRIFPAGEEHKNLGTFGEILQFFARCGLDRSDAAVALGGGVTGDLTGFAAGCYMRGIRFVQLPTSLLAAVDSSVGGKTAVDLPEGKNLAGLFHQPSLVLCDTDCLSTLPGAEWKNGLAEAVKTAVLAGNELFRLLESDCARKHSEKIIGLCVRYKGGVVERDERERGERKLLNLGHTAGHAIELCSGYSVPHGLAVSMGLALITRWAARRGFCDRRDAERILLLLRALSLPTGCDYTPQELADAALRDKKRAGGTITLAVPARIGDCRLCRVPTDDLADIFALGMEAL